jgi:hypothetical protein
LHADRLLILVTQCKDVFVVGDQAWPIAPGASGVGFAGPSDFLAPGKLF